MKRYDQQKILKLVLIICFLTSVSMSLVNNLSLAKSNQTDSSNSSIPIAKTAITPNIGIIYYSNATLANDYKSFVESEGYSANTINVGSASLIDIESADLFMISDDTGSLSTWSGNTTLISDITATNKPIIAIGEGGYSFFGKLNLTIGYPYGWHNSITSANYTLISSSSPIFSYPNTIPTGNISIYPSTSYVAIYTPSIIDPGVKSYVLDPTDINHSIVISSGCNYLLWGFSADPFTFESMGKQLFINVLNYYSTMSIGSITVLQPIGGSTTWQAGTNQIIKWNSTGSISAVQIDLYNISSHVMIITSSTANVGYFNWSIPTSLPDGVYKIIIVAVGYSSCIGSSSGTFKINAVQNTTTTTTTTSKQTTNSSPNGQSTTSTTSKTSNPNNITSTPGFTEGLFFTLFIFISLIKIRNRHEK